jgi:hypothetical protein
MTKEVIEALMRSASYDEKVENIELIQTHISFVFLTGKFVYKVKKAVDFGFLDFTTLEKRRFYCDEELRINKRLCGDMYLEVVPINKSKEGKIKVKGEGETIEYAVKMRQLPQETMMTRLLEEGKVTKDEIDKIARLLADFHAKAKTGEEVNQYGSVKQVKANWIQNFDQTRDLRGEVIDAKKFDFIEAEVLNFIEKNDALFKQRIANGRVRECHGDVHSGNIFIVKNSGRIFIFDAIEFNKAFSCSDIAAEVAFLAMDLDFHGKKDLADFFVERYVRYSKDEKMLKLLPFYKCYRAYVRAKVTGFKLSDPSISIEEKEKAKILTKRYFDLALEYAEEL